MGPYARDPPKKQFKSHKDRPSAVQGGHHQYNTPARRSRSPRDTTHEALQEAVEIRKQDERRKSSTSTRRRNPSSSISPSKQRKTPQSANRNQQEQRRKGSASTRRRNTPSGASPSGQTTTPQSANRNQRDQQTENSASSRQRNTSSSISPSDEISTPPPRSTSRTYSAETPSQSPIDMRSFRLDSAGTVESPFQTLSPLQQELGRYALLNLELKRQRSNTSTTQESPTPTPDRISAQPLQHGQVSPERVPKRPSTDLTSNTQTQTQRLRGAVHNSSTGHQTRTSSTSSSPVSPLQPSPVFPLYHSSGSPTEFNPQQLTPRINTSPDSTTTFRVPSKPLPKPSGSFKSHLHVDTSTKTSPK
jgi:hypothetical protein